MAEAADRIASDLSALGIRKAFFAGLSMGGYAVFEFLRRKPEMAAGAVFCDTTAFPDDEARLGKRDQVLKLLDEGKFEEVLKPFIHSVLWENGPRFELSRDFILGMARELGAFTYARSVRSIRDRGGYLDVLENSEIPMLFVSGEHDLLSPPSLAEKMAGLAKNGDWAVIADAAHMTAVENPVALASAMGDFFRNLMLPG